MRFNFKISSRPKPSSDAWAITFLICVPCVLFLPGLLSGKMLYGFDTLGLAVPFHAEVMRCLAAGQWPLWLNGVFGGMPGIASCNLQFAYPTDFIGFLCGLSLPVMDILDATAHVALAGVGMFLFLRRLGRGSTGALLGACFFALAGCELSQVLGGFYNLAEGVAWLPWAFWAAHKAETEDSLFAWGLCGLVFALQILAGAAQLFVYTLAAVACFVLGPWRGLSAEKARSTASPRGLWGPYARALGGLGLSLSAAFLLSAPQLWPTLQYLPLTARHAYTHAQFIGGSFSPSEMLTWIAPGLFGWQEPTYHGSMGTCFTSEYFGLLPWALAAGALASCWRRETLTPWLAGLAVAALFFGQNWWTPFYPLFRRLPVLSGFRDWSRVLFLLTFAICCLAARGWEALQEERTRGTALRGAALFGVLALAGLMYAWGVAKESAAAAAPAMPWIAGSPGHVADALTTQARDSLRTAWAMLAAGSGVVWLSARRLGPATALMLALAFHGLDLSGMESRCVRFVDPRTAMPAPVYTNPAPPRPGLEPWRVFDADPRQINRAMLLGYENLAGAESMPMTAYLRAQASMQAVPGRWQAWLSLMNVRYVFRHSQQAPYLPGDKVTIYENRSVFPRAWLVNRVVAAPSQAAAFSLLADPRFHPRAMVTLQYVPPDLRPPYGRPPEGGVQWLARTPQTFSLGVSTDKTAVLVLSNFWYPSWKARVDGVDTPILEADGGLQAVLLTPGRHRVDVRLDPSLFYDALAACLAGLAALLGLWRLDAQALASKSGPSHDF